MILRTVLFVSLLLTSLSPVAWAQEPAAAEQVDTGTLDRAIGSILSVGAVSKSKVGIYAVDLKTGQVLAANREDQTFNPASNQKLLTASVALERLGPGTRFTTELLGEIDGSKVVGDLYVRAEGDPGLHFEHLVKWAIELREKGIEKVEGGIVVDEGAFGSGLPPAFDQKDEDAAYRPAYGAFSVSFNGVAVIVEPGKVGGEAVVRLDPPNDYVTIENSAATVSGKTRRAYVSARTEGDRTVVKVTGKIGNRATPVVSRKRIEAPGLFAGAALKKALESVGIEVAGEVSLGETGNGAKTLVSQRSESVARLVYLMNKFSNNFMAEMLFRHAGAAEGSFDAATSQANYVEVVSELGVAVGGLAVKNGSGLYDGNVVTPKQIVELLVAMAKHRYRPEFEASLPIAGVDGTLSRRMSKGETAENLRGKTGTLNEVTALSGYLTTKSGRPVAYAIIFNDTPIYAWRLRSAQDDIARAIANFDR